MRALRALALTIALLAVASAASASTIWTFHDTTLQGYGPYNPVGPNPLLTVTVTGSFEVNAALNAIVDWNVTVDGTDPTPWDYTYNDGNAGNTAVLPAVAGSPDNFYFAYFGGGVYLTIKLAENLIETAAFKQINLVAGTQVTGSGTYSCASPCASLVSSGYITANANGAAPIPEPATLALFGTGLAGVAGAIRRRKRA